MIFLVNVVNKYYVFHNIEDVVFIVFIFCLIYLTPETSQSFHSVIVQRKDFVFERNSHPMASLIMCNNYNRSNNRLRCCNHSIF